MRLCIIYFSIESGWYVHSEYIAHHAIMKKIEQIMETTPIVVEWLDISFAIGSLQFLVGGPASKASE